MSERNRKRFSDAQREAVYALKSEGKSGTAVREICLRGFKDLPPFEIAAQYANDLYNKMHAEREAMQLTGLGADVSPSRALSILVRRTISICDREVQRLSRTQSTGKLDVAALNKLTGALRNLEGIAKRLPVDPGDDAPSDTGAAEPENTFLSALLDAEDGDQDDAEPAPPPAIGDVRLNPRGRNPFKRADTAPTTPPETPAQAHPAPLTGVHAQIAAAAKAGRARRDAATREAETHEGTGVDEGIATTLAETDQAQAHDHATRSQPRTNAEADHDGGTSHASTHEHPTLPPAVLRALGQA